MRRFLIFALLFGAGLFVLMRLDRGDEDSADPQPGNAVEQGAPPSTPTDGAAGDGQPGAGEAPDEANGSGSASGEPTPPVSEETPIDTNQEFVIIRGATEFSRFHQETGKPKLAFETANMQPLGDPREFLYQFTNTRIRAWDEGDASEAMVLTAERAQGKIELSKTSEFGGLADDGLLTMQGVHVQVASGHPLAPFELTGDELTSRLELGRLKGGGQEPVVLTGNGFSARGWNLDLDRDAGRVYFLGGGEFEFELENGETAKFVTEPGSPLRLHHDEQGGLEKFLVNVDGGGTFTMTGSNPWVLKARGLALRGTRLPGEGVRLERVDTQGAIDAVRGKQRFAGTGARLVRLTETKGFDLQIENNPKVELELEGTGGGSEFVEIRGLGPLIVTAEAVEGAAEQADIEFQKEGWIEFPGTTSTAKVEFQEGLSVWVDRLNRSGTFRATGHVHLSQGAAWLRTEVLDSIIWSAEHRVIDVSCEGKTRARLVDSDGAQLDFSAALGALVQLQGIAWRVPQASGVLTTQVGAAPIEIKADELRDLNWEARTFRVWGNVGVQNALGIVQCDRAVSEGNDRLLLTGTPERPAQLELASGSPFAKELLSGKLSAQKIDMRPDRLLCEGAVSSDLVLSQGRVIQSSEELRLVLDQSDAAKLGYQIFSSGECQVSWQVAGEELMTADCESFEWTGEAPSAVLDAEGLPRSETTNPYTLVAHTVRSMQWRQGEDRFSLSAGSLESKGVVQLGPNGRQVVPGPLRADGGVDISISGQTRAEASAKTLILEPNPRMMTLVPYEGERIVISGMLPKLGVPYRMQCKDLKLSEDRLEALEPEFRSGLAILPTQTGQAPQGRQPGESLVRAGHLLVTTQGIVFSDGVIATGTDMDLVPLSIRSNQFTLKGDLRRAAEQGANLESMERAEIEGGFLLVYGGLARAKGREMVVLPTSILLKGDGKQRVRVELADLYIETERMEVDLDRFLVKTTRGVMRGGGASSEWALDYASLYPVERNEETMFAIASPQYVEGKRTANANWAMAWIHPEAWRQRGRNALYGEPLPEDRAWAPSQPISGQRPDAIEELLNSLSNEQLPHYLRAVLLEGNVEASVAGRRLARAESLYCDVDGVKAWMKEAEITRILRMGGKDHKLRIQTGELTAQASGALHADSAILTTCDHDEPHYVIETKDLRLIPRGDQRWRFSAEDNRIAFHSGFGLPMPSIRNVVLDSQGGFEGFENEEGEVTTVENIVLRNTPRFGTSLGTNLAYDIDKVGKFIARIFQFDTDVVRGRWKVDGAYLSSRGPLLGLGLQLRESGREKAQREEFWLDLFVRAIPDEGEDKGILRVPSDETDSLRHWFSARGRYPFDDRQWIDVVYNQQSDAGVQAEFLQDEYQHYEERDSYVHWRKARDGHYFNARYQWQEDSFRTVVEKLPSVGAFRGLHELFSIGSIPINYSASIDAANLQRREGDPRFERVFLDEDGNPDGFGDRSVIRADTTHRVEAPLPLDLPGTSVTPFAEARFTAWDEGALADESPTRFATFAGARVQTLLTRVAGDSYHTLIPRVEYAENTSFEQEGGAVVGFDEVDRAIDGNYAEVGLRSLWRRPDVRRWLDFDVAYRERTDREGGVPDSSELRFLGGFRTEVRGWPVGIEQDFRQDPDEGSTLYSNSILALKPNADLLLQFGHQRGDEPGFGALFETASLDMRYRINDKWELGVRNSTSILEGGNLQSEFTLRRFHHDFVLELEVSRYAGEGGTGFGINLVPLLAWKRPKLGILDQ